MEFNKQLNWKHLYRHQYYKSFIEFYDFIIKVRENFYDNSHFERKLISEKYLNFYNETLKLFEVFFANNCYFLSEERLIVIYILSCNILQDGILFYKLHLALKDLQNDNCCLDKEYLTDEYLNLFKQINVFFERRMDLEKNYDL